MSIYTMASSTCGGTNRNINNILKHYYEIQIATRPLSMHPRLAFQQYNIATANGIQQICHHENYYGQRAEGQVQRSTWHGRE